MFGQPSEILGRVTSSFLEHIHYSSIPDSTSSAKSFGSMPKDASSTHESAPGIVRPESGLVGRSPSGSGSRQRKTSSIEQEDALPSQTQEDRVPSSRTPSPMKAPVRKTSSMRLSLSPVKIDHVATKALQESITSLLGKRPSPDTDEPGDLVKGKQGHGQGGRTGKRARPQRSKVSCTYYQSWMWLNSPLYRLSHVKRRTLKLVNHQDLAQSPEHDLGKQTHHLPSNLLMQATRLGTSNRTLTNLTLVTRSRKQRVCG